MKILGVMANCDKSRAPVVLERLQALAGPLGLSLVADEATAALLPSARKLPVEQMFEAVEAVMALGGDGTMLRAARAMNGRQIPLIGVNIGGLGFLTSEAEGELERALRSLASGHYQVSAHAILEGGVHREGKEIDRYRALNDIVVSRGPVGRVVTLDVSVGEERVTSYVCDGLIVSTPAGSTGHSLSAGGPILTPATRALVVTPICPHTLSWRPLVVPDASRIRVTVAGSHGELLLSVDGQVGRALKQGDRVEITRSAQDVQLIQLPGHSYFAVLRQKLHWSGSSV